MTRDEALAGQPRKFASRAAAQDAHRKAVERARTEHKARQALAFVRLQEAVDGALGKPLAEIAELHMPHPNEWGRPTCPACRAGCCDDGDDFPCDTMAAVLKTLPDEATHEHLALLKQGSPSVPFEDFWVDPMVTVTFAHFTEFELPGGQIKCVAPNAQHTMPLRKAEEFYSRLLRSSMERVDRLTGVKRLR